MRPETNIVGYLIHKCKQNGSSLHKLRKERNVGKQRQRDKCKTSLKDQIKMGNK